MEAVSWPGMRCASLCVATQPRWLNLSPRPFSVGGPKSPRRGRNPRLMYGPARAERRKSVSPRRRFLAAFIKLSSGRSESGACQTSVLFFPRGICDAVTSAGIDGGVAADRQSDGRNLYFAGGCRTFSGEKRGDFGGFEIRVVVGVCAGSDGTSGERPRGATRHKMRNSGFK